MNSRINGKGIPQKVSDKVGTKEGSGSAFIIQLPVV